jgi:hypothetical protein
MWEKIKLVTSAIFDFCLPFLRQLAKDAGPILAKAALAAVKIVAANYSGATSSAKRDAAFELIADDLKKQGVTIGIDIGTSLVNAAIEIAYQKIKDSGK